MAMQVAQSGLAKKYGGRLDAAVAAHSTDETDYGFERLPAGIQNGVAQLSKCYFDEFKTGSNKGEYYMRAEGVVVSPLMHRLPDGTEMKVAGRTTSIMIPACDTKSQDGKLTPQAENIAKIMNELRKLGGDTTNVKNGQQLEVLAAAIQQARPLFKFTTSTRNPRPGTNDQPGVWENWNGAKDLEGFVPPQDPNQVQDDTQQTESGVAESTGATSVNGHPVPITQVEYTDQGSTNAADVDALVEKVSGGDAAAQHQLQEIAEKFGVKDQADAATSWEESGEIIKAAMAQATQLQEPETPSAQQETSAEPTRPDPAVKAMYKYKPLVKGPGGKMVKVKKAVDVEVIKTYPKNRTADLKSMADGKTLFKGISYDELE